MTTPAPGDQRGMCRLAAAHGLDLDDSTLRINELGLDFRVAIANTTDGEAWVLRTPRRPDVTARADVEARVLKLVAPRLSVAVPDWRIHTPELIAYPLLPGEPGLELEDTGTPVWMVDVASPVYATSLGDLLAELHGIDSGEAQAAGIAVRTPDETRAAWRADIDRVTASFEVAADLTDRWDDWLADDSYWPEWSVLTHGEIYPAHTLVTDEAITGVLDWTTAAVGDPARDFVFHQVSARAEAFDTTVSRYVERGGRVWPRLAEHCTELFSASPVSYGIFALDTGDEEHRAAAAALLNPAASEPTVR